MKKLRGPTRGHYQYATTGKAPRGATGSPTTDVFAPGTQPGTIYDSNGKTTPASSTVAGKSNFSKA